MLGLRTTRIINSINFLNEWSGKVVSFGGLIVMGITIYDVAARYFFMQPLLWGGEVSTMVFGGYFLLGGGYTLRYKAHVNVDILVGRLNKTNKLLLELIACVFLFLFSGIMIWQGGEMALRAWEMKEASASAWGGPIYPVKMLIPVGCLLLLIQGVANFLDVLDRLKRGKQT